MVAHHNVKQNLNSWKSLWFIESQPSKPKSQLTMMNFWKHLSWRLKKKYKYNHVQLIFQAPCHDCMNMCRDFPRTCIISSGFAWLGSLSVFRISYQGLKRHMPQQSSSLIFPHRLNHKSQHTVLGHMYVVSYFSLVYFFCVNLNGCFVRSVLIVVTHTLCCLVFGVVSSSV